ncbi:hypothetical protein NDU88_001571 [Pleurodeles waltl]|uniref:Uncharacterized protein n=1 Tax=Pleurodeles waltl TaxID=8319 RepID=A0AAV7UT75_PLEWA|nr:hypothetical protein NDU88_001571 [Pleurodeles waltl]
MPPCECQEMVAHNEYHKLSTRNESRVLPIRMSACKCQKKPSAHSHAQESGAQPDLRLTALIKNHQQSEGQGLEDQSRSPERKFRKLLLLCTGSSE